MLITDASHVRPAIIKQVGFFEPVCLRLFVEKHQRNQRKGLEKFSAYLPIIRTWKEPAVRRVLFFVALYFRPVKAVRDRWRFSAGDDRPDAEKRTPQSVFSSRDGEKGRGKQGEWFGEEQDDPFPYAGKNKKMENSTIRSG